MTKSNKILGLGLLCLMALCSTAYVRINAAHDRDLQVFEVRLDDLEKNLQGQKDKLEDAGVYINSLLASHATLKSDLAGLEAEPKYYYIEAAIYFYMSKLADPDFVSYYNHDYTWYIAAEALGDIGKPAIPHLIKRLESQDPYERSMVFYALALASQDEDVDTFTGGDYLNLSAFEEEAFEENMEIIRLWWDKYGEYF